LSKRKIAAQMTQKREKINVEEMMKKKKWADICREIVNKRISKHRCLHTSYKV